MPLISSKHFFLLLLPTSLHPLTYLSSLPFLPRPSTAYCFSALTFNPLYPSPLFTLLWPPLMESHSLYNCLLFSPFLPLMPSSLLLTFLFSPPRNLKESSRLSPSTPGSFHHGPGPQWAQLVPNLYFGPPGCSCGLLWSHVLCHGWRRWRFWLSLPTGFALLLQGTPGLAGPEAAVQGSIREANYWGIKGPAGLPWLSRQPGSLTQEERAGAGSRTRGPGAGSPASLIIQGELDGIQRQTGQPPHRQRPCL